MKVPSTPTAAESAESQTPMQPCTDCRQIDKSKLSPMYKHYVEVKEKYPHSLLLYRCGDFFETFFQDAVIVSQELELVLTSKHGGEIGRVAMTGVPHHAREYGPRDASALMLPENPEIGNVLQSATQAFQSHRRKDLIQSQRCSGIEQARFLPGGCF